MDEETRGYFDGVMKTVNTKLDDILDKLSVVRKDIENNQGHIVYALEDSLSLGKRITKLEDEIRRLRPL
jgi:hypothetical protein